MSPTNNHGFIFLSLKSSLCAEQWLGESEMHSIHGRVLDAIHVVRDVLQDKHELVEHPLYTYRSPVGGASLAELGLPKVAQVMLVALMAHFFV